MAESKKIWDVVSGLQENIMGRGHENGFYECGEYKIAINPTDNAKTTITVLRGNEKWIMENNPTLVVNYADGLGRTACINPGVADDGKKITAEAEEGYDLQLVGQSVVKFYQNFAETLYKSQLTPDDDWNSRLASSPDQREIVYAQWGQTHGRAFDIEKKPDEMTPEEYFAALDETLDKIIGLEPWKDEVRRLAARTHHRSKSNGRMESGSGKLVSIKAHALNIVLDGDIGSGKTFAVDQMADIYARFGLLPINEKNPRDIIKTLEGSELASEAGECGLAEMLAQLRESKQPVIIHVKHAGKMVESRPGDDSRQFASRSLARLRKFADDTKDTTSLVFSCYPGEAEQFLELDPSFRMSFGRIIKCPDYTAPEMKLMLDNMLEREGLKMNKEASDEVLRVFELVTRFDRNGNGKFVDYFYDDILSRLAVRTKFDMDLSKLILAETADVSEKILDSIGGKDSFKNLKDIFADDLIGCEAEKAFVSQFIIAQQQSIEYGKPIVSHNKNVILGGPPGIGKTTYARFFAQELFRNGVMINGEPIKNGFLDVKAHELMGQYVGNTEHMVAKLLARAKGKVLFIDEYSKLLDRATYGKQVLKALLQPAAEQHCIIIFADYAEHIPRLLAASQDGGIGDAGMERRYNILHMTGYNAEQLTLMGMNRAREAELEFDAEAKAIFTQVMKEALESGNPNFGQADYARIVFEAAHKNHYDMLYKIKMGQNRRPTEQEINYITKGSIERLLKGYKPNLADVKAVAKTARQSGSLGDVIFQSVLDGDPARGVSFAAKTGEG